MTVHFEDFLISCRPYSEYRDMFALTESDLHSGAILDCPAGASSFAAEARARGAQVLSADAVYDLPADELLDNARDGIERGGRFIEENEHRFTWKYFSSVANHHEARRRAWSIFARDYTETRGLGFYRTALLPRLPFDDQAFRLTLSGHFLFTYADRLDFQFHLDSLREMMRVTSGEVRVFPLVDFEARPVSFLKALRDQLGGDGICTALTAVPYEFQLGANEMLVLSRNGRE